MNIKLMIIPCYAMQTVYSLGDLEIRWRPIVYVSLCGACTPH